VPATASSLGMNTSLLATSTAACGQSRCRELRVLHACFSTFLRRSRRSSPPHMGIRPTATETLSYFLQRCWQISCLWELDPHGNVPKALFHEMNLKVAELTLSGAAKCPQSMLGKDQC
jgi:hypothetical protein